MRRGIDGNTRTLCLLNLVCGQDCSFPDYSGGILNQISKKKPADFHRYGHVTSVNPRTLFESLV